MTTAQQVLDALRPYALEKNGSEWRCNSPLRVGSNSHGFTLTIDDDEHGAWIDHVSGEKGSLYELAAKLGIEPPKRAPIADTKRAYTGLADYAAAHGVMAEVFLKAGWLEVEHQGRKALSFPTKTGLVHRFIDGEKPSFKYPSEYKACWYGLTKAQELQEDVFKPVVITNGAPSVVVAHAHGIPACCVTNGEKAIPEHLLTDLDWWNKGTFLIALDCDDTGRKGALEIYNQLAGKHNAHIVDLGLGDKGDLADFCRLWGKDAQERFYALPAKTPEKPPVEDTSVKDLAGALDRLSSVYRQDEKNRKQGDLALLAAQAQALVDRVLAQSAAPTMESGLSLGSSYLEVVKQNVLHPGETRGLVTHIDAFDKMVGGFEAETYIIYGATNMGKSWLLVTIASALAKQSPGLIIPTESPPPRWWNRIIAHRAQVEADKMETGLLSEAEYKRVTANTSGLQTAGLVFLRGGSPTINQVRATVLEARDKRDIQWVAIDGVQKIVSPGADAIYGNTKAVSNALQSLYQEAGVPIIATSQIGRGVADRPRGDKLPRIDDGYGGSPIEQDAGVVLGMYDHSYYVNQQIEEPNPARYPDNTVSVLLLKTRWRGGAGKTACYLEKRPGMGFFSYTANNAPVTTEVKTFDSSNL